VRATRVLATLRALVSFRPMTTSRSRDGGSMFEGPGVCSDGNSGWAGRD
jgi:hypothetical protein